VSLALGHEPDATLRHGGDNLAEHFSADVPLPLLRRDLDDAADLDAVDGSRRDARGLSELVDGQFVARDSCTLNMGYWAIGPLLAVRRVSDRSPTASVGDRPTSTAPRRSRA
jgi:hypothetical protein